MNRNKPLAVLTKAEEEVMQVIWLLGRCLVRDIIEKLGNPDLPHSTISSVVRILEKKSFVAHKAYGKTYEYFPIIEREDYMRHNVAGIMEKYFGGSPRRLVSFLVESKDLDLKELDDLLQTLNNIKEH